MSASELRDDANLNDGPPVREAARKANERIKETRDLLYGEGGTVQDISDSDGDRLVDEEAYASNTKGDYGQQVSEDGPKNTSNVIGGYKATIANPKVSEEAKDNARSILKEEYDVEV
ncbi:hypothetical protein PLEOSDRAFT_1088887 [Pleurotus ostreatus PC15]|uniref:Uncharacterized protein n=1 Tax=Pleurotus ostreatus (strain PC15) TaxID=1137138 RepID=A0A067NL23_PLEO1|nr:hypothetical protein PLEOSDRAFT_1088887 [Pleurotus ostreatus PC15]